MKGLPLFFKLGYRKVAIVKEDSTDFLKLKQLGFPYEKQQNNYVLFYRDKHPLHEMDKRARNGENYYRLLGEMYGYPTPAIDYFVSFMANEHADYEKHYAIFYHGLHFTTHAELIKEHLLYLIQHYPLPREAQYLVNVVKVGNDGKEVFRARTINQSMIKKMDFEQLIEDAYQTSKK